MTSFDERWRMLCAAARQAPSASAGGPRLPLRFPVPPVRQPSLLSRRRSAAVAILLLYALAGALVIEGRPLHLAVPSLGLPNLSSLSDFSALADVLHGAAHER